jgi:prepilin-type N-terminal cleavage/methylation domain-containing protein
MKRLRVESGFTLVELLIGMSLMVVVLGATISVLVVMQRVGVHDTDQNIAQDKARTAIDQIARDLRNVAEPTPEVGTPPQPQPTIERAQPYDLVLRSIDPTGASGGQNAFHVRRVRYCLSGDIDGSAKLWKQTQTWTTQLAPAMPSTTSCDGTGWPTAQVVADHITNGMGGRTDRPAFSFNPEDFSDPTRVKALRPELWVDANPQDAQREVRLSTAYFLRNQNQPPVSDAAGDQFTVTVVARSVVLNALGFEDPEGSPLSYVWYDGTSKIGTGITLSVAASPGTHTYSLKVLDDKSLGTDAPPQVVTVT